MLVLGIESSCDETAAAVVRGSEVLADVVHSQVPLHAEYGGVVPELAARDHLVHLRPVVEAALAEAGTELNQVDGLAVTCQPGLSGALLMGMQFASALAFALDRPLVGVDHLAGHLLAGFLAFRDQPAPPSLSFPFIGLLASGGHTGVYEVLGPEPEEMVQLGGTRDDAAGEAYDKVAKLLGLGYPGGPIVDRLASEGDADRIALSVPMADKSQLDLSFSGLKTNVMRWVSEHGRPGDDQSLRDLCAAFQRRVVDSLLRKTRAAAEMKGIRKVVLAGGVAANSELRRRAIEVFEPSAYELVLPSRRAATDNAAMIAYAGSFSLASGRDDRATLKMSPRTRLVTATRKGPGPRA